MGFIMVGVPLLKVAVFAIWIHGSPPLDRPVALHAPTPMGVMDFEFVDIHQRRQLHILTGQDTTSILSGALYKLTPVTYDGSVEVKALTPSPADLEVEAGGSR